MKTIKNESQASTRWNPKFFKSKDGQTQPLVLPSNDPATFTDITAQDRVDARDRINKMILEKHAELNNVSIADTDSGESED
jgi:hypothetical protein